MGVNLSPEVRCLVSDQATPTSPRVTAIIQDENNEYFIIHINKNGNCNA